MPDSDKQLKARRAWLEHYVRFSGLGIGNVGSESPQFLSQAASLLRNYEALIEENKDKYATLKRSLDLMANQHVVVPNAPKFSWTDGQIKALDSIRTWAKSKDAYFVLRGYAGTGKTTVLSTLARELSDATTLYTATTNKATKVLRSMLGDRACRTIYSALSLKMVEREDELVLMPSEDKFNLSGYRIVVVDESSMLNSEVIGYITETHKRFGIKFLFVCDPAQLPPVNEKISPVVELDCPTIELTEVVRHDNQILELATHIRNAVVSGKRVRPIEFSDEYEKCVWRLSGQGFIERLRKYASNGFTDVRAIAWRNRTVDRLNEVIRSELYSKADLDSGFWLPNDRIVLTEPVQQGRFIVATTDDEGIVSGVDISNDPQTQLMCYNVSVKLEIGKVLRIKVIHEDSQDKFDSRLAEYAHEARKPGNGKVWQKFWGLKNRFTGIRHSYALTAHRSQGSTFKTVFVDAGDILANPDRDTANRCLYVGATRASDKLFMSGFPK